MLPRDQALDGVRNPDVFLTQEAEFTTIRGASPDKTLRVGIHG
jgi:hypothetical protein